MERINGKPIVDYDDIAHLIDPKLRNLDLRKVDEFSKAIHGVSIAERRQPFGRQLESWQSNLRCLRSITNLGIKKKTRK